MIELVRDAESYECLRPLTRRPSAPGWLDLIDEFQVLGEMLSRAECAFKILCLEAILVCAIMCIIHNAPINRSYHL
jgi:hypothetical protein